MLKKNGQRQKTEQPVRFTSRKHSAFRLKPATTKNHKTQKIRKYRKIIRIYPQLLTQHELMAFKVLFEHGGSAY